MKRFEAMKISHLAKEGKTLEEVCEATGKSEKEVKPFYDAYKAEAKKAPAKPEKGA